MNFDLIYMIACFFFQHGLTPLHMSCQGNHSSTSVLLIDNKAPVNAVATVRTHDLLQKYKHHVACNKK